MSGEGWGIGSETHVRDKTGCVPDILKISVYKSFHHHCSHSEGHIQSKLKTLIYHLQIGSKLKVPLLCLLKTFGTDR